MESTTEQPEAKEIETRIDYWKEVKKEMPTITKEIGNVMLLIHNSAEFKQIINFINKLKPQSLILYISLTKTYASLKQDFGDLKQDLFVIDCVSQLLLFKEPGENCVYSRPPGSLSEIVDLIATATKTIKPHYIILDSLSQFIDFSSFTDMPSTVFEFYEKLKALDDQLFAKSILLYDENTFMSLKNVPVYYFDLILRMDIKEHKPYWKG